MKWFEKFQPNLRDKYWVEIVVSIITYCGSNDYLGRHSEIVPKNLKHKVEDNLSEYKKFAKVCINLICKVSL